MTDQRCGGARERAAAELRAGRPAIARERLKGYPVQAPWSLSARELFAQVQCADGHPEEAGRWGFLVAGAATPTEQAAFERASPYRHQPVLGVELVATNMLMALRWPTGLAADDPYADAVLAELDARAAAEAEAAARRRYIPWHRRLVARITGEEPAEYTGPGPGPRRAPRQGAHLELEADDHLARLVAGLRAHRVDVTQQRRPVDLLAHLRTAGAALDGSQPKWLELLGTLEDDLDQALYRYHPVPTEAEARVAAHAALNVLDRAASPLQ